MDSFSNNDDKTNYQKLTELFANRKKRKNISKANIEVTELPLDMYPEEYDKITDKLYGLLIDDEILRTPNDHPIYCENERAMVELSSELEFTNQLKVDEINLYSLCCTQIDFEKEWDFTKGAIKDFLYEDIIFQPCAGPEVIDQMKYYRAIVSFLSNKGIQYPYTFIQPDASKDALGSFVDSAINTEDKVLEKTVVVYNEIIKDFDKAQRTIMVNVLSNYNSITLGLMLATGGISSQEFATAYLFANNINSKVWTGSKRFTETALMESTKKRAECMSRYLSRFSSHQNGYEVVRKIIEAGENQSIEFKSTLRKSIGKEAPDREIEHEVLKTLVAFFNTDGGDLLIGVADNHAIIGIDEDGFPNEDKFMLHFTGIFNERIGKTFFNLVNPNLVKINDKKILYLHCKPSRDPVFVKRDQKEEFYIRTGPSTVQLTGKQLLDYYQSHFHQKNAIGK